MEQPQKPAILMVDDTQDVTFYKKIILPLKNAGFYVLTAENGEAALNLLKTNTIIAVISDFVMPNMSGIELCIEINRLYPDMPVIIMSSDIRYAQDTAKQCSGQAPKVTDWMDKKEATKDPKIITDLLQMVLQNRSLPN